MKIEETTVTLRRLRAAEGHVLTQAADVKPTDRTFGSEITLSAVDSPDNWREITDEEAEELKRLQLDAYRQQQ